MGIPAPAVPIPWAIAWIGFAIIVSGMVLGLHAIGQRQSNKVSDTGMALAAIGFGLCALVALANGTVLLLHAMGGAAVQASASAARNPDAYR